MSKTNIILLFVIGILVIGVGLGTYLVLKPKDITLPKAANNESGFLKTTKEASLNADKTYVDTAGFSFGYPAGLNITDKSENNDLYYSWLDIKGSYGDLGLAVTDTEFSLLADWQKANPNASLVGATTLGGIKANQYTLAGNLVTVAIDDDVLYEVKSKAGEPNLEKVHNLIVDTFKFADQLTTATNGGGNDTIYEEEETIE